MSKKITLEARIVEWAESAPIETVQVILGIVRAKVKARTPTAPKPTRVRKRTNAKGVSGGTGVTFDTAKIEAAS